MNSHRFQAAARIVPVFLFVLAGCESALAMPHRVAESPLNCLVGQAADETNASLRAAGTVEADDIAQLIEAHLDRADAQLQRRLECSMSPVLELRIPLLVDGVVPVAATEGVAAR